MVLNLARAFYGFFSIANKLAVLRPNRIVLIVKGADTKCFVLSNSVLALRTINALAHGNGSSVAVQPLNAPGRPT